MTISKENYFDLCETVDRLNNDQKMRLLFRLHENPITNVNPVQEAISTFDALDDVQIFEFISLIKKQVDPETWELMV